MQENLPLGDDPADGVVKGIVLGVMALLRPEPVEFTRFRPSRLGHKSTMAREKDASPTACHACEGRHPGLIIPHDGIPASAGMTRGKGGNDTRRGLRNFFIMSQPVRRSDTGTENRTFYRRVKLWQGDSKNCENLKLNFTYSQLTMYDIIRTIQHMKWHVDKRVTPCKYQWSLIVLPAMNEVITPNTIFHGSEVDA